MADFAAPSFSLGIDLDVDPDASTEEEGDGDEMAASLGGPRGGRSPRRSVSSSTSGSCRRLDQQREADTDGDDPAEAIEVAAPACSLAFKRLKRGPPARPPQKPSSTPAGPTTRRDVAPPFTPFDDDIEEFSSQEDPAVGDGHTSRHVNTAFSSPTISLHGQGILSTLSATKSKAPVVTPNSSISLSASVDASSNKKVFPRLTASPLTIIQSLDSDSDDLSIGEDARVCAKKKPFDSSHCLSKTQQQKQDRTSPKRQNESLWKGFSPETNNNLAIPSLNEFCEEYFKSASSMQQHPAAPNDFVDGASGYGPQRDWDLPDLQPPSHRYFNHQDARIQNLVRQRLHNFVPLGDVKCAGNQQRNTVTLDYMGQFGQKKAPCQVRGLGEKSEAWTANSKPRNQKIANGQEVSGTWVTPQTRNANPKDAGKRRVHADRRSVGHWYTAEDGKKVYVTKDGQELSGRIAYRHYIKESGRGFRPSKKKTAVGRKSKATA